MIGKEKLHVVALLSASAPVSRNNQAHLKDKSRRRAKSFGRTPRHPPPDRDPRDSNGSEETMTQIQALNDGHTRPRQCHRPHHRLPLRPRGLRRILRHLPLRHRLRRRPGGAEDHRQRQRPGRRLQALIVNLLLMSIFAIQHSVMARPAVQALVDAVRAEVGRAQHLCAAGEPGARAAVLAVAADAGGGLADRRSAARHGGDRCCRSSAG